METWRERGSTVVGADADLPKQDKNKRALEKENRDKNKLVFNYWG